MTEKPLLKDDRQARQRDALVALAGARVLDGENLVGTLQRLTETCARTLDVARVSIWRYNATHTGIWCVDLYIAAEDQHSSGLELSADTFPKYFDALASMEVIAAHCAWRDSRTSEFTDSYARPLGITSMLDAPVHLGGAIDGVLCHEHIGPPRKWSADEETFAVAVANLVSLALEGAERQQATRALSRAHAQLEQMLEHSAVIIYRLQMVEGQLQPVTVSTNITRILGYSVAEGLEAEWWAANLHPEDRDRAFAASAQLFALSSNTIEYRVRHRDGSYRWVEDNQRVLRDSQGEPSEVIGVWTDITARKDAEAALAKSNRDRIDLSRQAGMAEVATTVLHNVGNVLNSVNVSAEVSAERIRNSSIGNLERAVTLLLQQGSDLPAFFQKDPRSSHLPAYLKSVCECLRADQSELLTEMALLTTNIDHIKQIVAMQQSYARVSGLVETLAPAELVEDALRLNAGSMAQRGVEVIREFEEVPPIAVEKHKVIQVLVNLIRNAEHACEAAVAREPRVSLRIQRTRRDSIEIAVTDNGTGIRQEHLTSIFQYGFTTRPNGHGWGLHSSALSAKELGGSLTAQSDGPGCGATFRLELPLKLQPGLS